MLSNIVIETSTVNIGSEPVLLRGVSFMDLASMLLQNRDSLATMFTIAERMGVNELANLNEQTISQIGFGLLAEAPLVVAHLIAIAAGEPDQWEKALDLPAPDQLKLMREVVRLTLVDETSFGEFVGNVAAAVTTMKMALPQATTTVLKTLVTKIKQ